MFKNHDSGLSDLIEIFIVIVMAVFVCA